jgi:hypothetical protein
MTAFSICLISDIWTNKSMLDFMGLAVNIVDRNFKRQTLVIGMKQMPGPHNAENIIAVLMDLINRYENLDKSRIHG